MLMYYANLAFYVTLQIPTFVIGLCFYPLFGNKVAWRLYQSSLHVVNYLFVGIRFLNQYPTSKPHILLVNHTTICDSYLGVTLDAPYRSLVKREILYCPLIGQLLYLLNMIFVDRRSATSRAHSKGLIAQSVMSDITIIFPQGTREPGKTFASGDVHLKRGSIEVAVVNNAPVVVVYHNLHHRICDKTHALHHRRKVYAISSGIIRLSNDELDLPLEQRVDILHSLIYEEFRRLETIVWGQSQ
jgi:1-acyl-sn-glycerol-3-phosphate acyltransferase